MLGYTDLQCHWVWLWIVAERGVQFLWELHVVVAVDTQDILHYVALALYVHAVARYTQLPGLTLFAHNLHFHGMEDTLNQLFAQLLTNQRMCTVDVELYWEWCKHFTTIYRRSRSTIYSAAIYNLHRNLTACYLLDEQCAAFEYVEGVIWVATALIAEAGIGRELMTASGLADAHWVEVGTLQEDIGSGLRDT